MSSPNGLADVHWLHVGLHNGSSRIDKDMRKVFVKGRIQDVRKQFQVFFINLFIFWHLSAFSSVFNTGILFTLLFVCFFVCLFVESDALLC